MDIEAVLPSPEADEIAALCFSASEYESYTALGPEVGQSAPEGMMSKI